MATGINPTKEAVEIAMAISKGKHKAGMGWFLKLKCSFLKN